MRQIAVALAWTALATVGCYIISRATSPLSAVRLYHSDVAGAAESTRGPSQLRVGAYNPGLFTRSVFDGVDEERLDTSMVVAAVRA